MLKCIDGYAGKAILQMMLREEISQKRTILHNLILWMLDTSIRSVEEKNMCWHIKHK